MLSNEKWFGASAPFYPETIDQSLRAEDGDNSRLHTTPSSAGNRKTWTLSIWFKRANLVNGALFSAPINNSTNGFSIFFDANELVLFEYKNTSQSSSFKLTSDALLRDTTNFYHLVAIFDTDSSGGGSADTGADARVRMYLNGKLMGVTLTGSIGADYQSLCWNNTYVHEICNKRTNVQDFDGYIAEVNFLDGTAVSHTQVGSDYILDELGEMKNGVWIPKDVSGLTYGTNGFRLDFSDNTDIGNNTKSTDGTMDFSVNGFVSTDVVLDSPTNNFATALASLAEPQDYQSYYKATYSEGNLKVTGSSSGWSNGSSNFGMTSGKWYAECRIGAKAGSGYIRFGMRSRPARTYDEYFWSDDGTGQIDGTTSPYSGRVGTYSAGDILMIALDLENNALYFGKNGTWENSATSAEISAGTTTNAFVASSSIVKTGDDNSGHAYFFYCQPHSTGSNITWNFGQDSSFAGAETAQGNSDSGDGTTDFYYTPPTGFLACNTVNLPDTTLSPNQTEQADDYFITTTYSGDSDNSTQISTGFKPDFVWIKNRTEGTSDGAGEHMLYDSTRGVHDDLNSNNTSAEDTNTNGLQEFGSTFFRAGSLTRTNETGDTYVAWNWKANGGTTSSNTDGSITSTVQASTDAGFSIATYTGTGSLGTVGHGLTNAPAVVIIKKRSASGNWVVGHHKNGFTGQLYFDSGAFSTNSGSFNNTAPTSTVVTINTDSTVNTSSATYVMYCFTEIEGYSKFGSYTGNGSADGTFVYTGFRPAWIMIKRTQDSGYGWLMTDNKRNTFNVVDKSLQAESSASESSTKADIDFLSNGFKLRNTNTHYNTNNKNMIFMAFAEQPFKFSNSR